MCAHQLRIADLPLTPMNAASPIPLYYQVEADLRALLNSEHIAPGDLLPTEHDLAEAYGVGRHTIRTALARLVTDDLIVRKAGHGTVAKDKQDRRQFSLARSFTRQMQELGLEPRSQILSSETRAVLPSDPRPLHDQIGAPCLVLDRLRFGGDDPIGIQRAYILLETCPDLPSQDFTHHSLYDILSNQYHLVITTFMHTVSAATADKRQADLLRLDTRAALLVVNTSAFLDTGALIEFSVGYYRADRYEYTTTQTSS